MFLKVGTKRCCKTMLESAAATRVLRTSSPEKARSSLTHSCEQGVWPLVCTLRTSTTVYLYYEIAWLLGQDVIT